MPADGVAPPPSTGPRAERRDARRDRRADRGARPADADDAVRAVIVIGAAARSQRSLSGGGRIFGAARRERRASIATEAGAVLRVFDMKKPRSPPSTPRWASITSDADGHPHRVRPRASASLHPPRRRARGVQHAVPRARRHGARREWCLRPRVSAIALQAAREPSGAAGLPLPAARELAAEIAENTGGVGGPSRQLMWRLLGADHPMEAHRSTRMHGVDGRRRMRKGVWPFCQAPGTLHAPPSAALPPFTPVDRPPAHF